LADNVRRNHFNSSTTSIKSTNYSDLTYGLQDDGKNTDTQLL